MENLRKVKIIKGEHKDKIGYFHGFFQCNWDGDAFPIAVIELKNGIIIELVTEGIQFIKKEDK